MNCDEPYVGERPIDPRIAVRALSEEMLLRNLMDVLRTFVECSEEKQRGILALAKIIADPSVDEEKKAAAEDALIESLYPHVETNELDK